MGKCDTMVSYVAIRASYNCVALSPGYKEKRCWKIVITKQSS